MKVTLHLGVHRTGTGSLDAFLRANAPVLTAAGIATWTAQTLRDGMVSGLVRPPESVTLPDERLGRRSVGLLRMRQTQLERRGVERLIVSGPSMIGTPGHCLLTRRLYPWPSERLGRFLPAFEDRCDRITLSIRAYDRFWASVLAGQIRLGRSLPAKSELDCLVTQPLRWRRLIEEIATSFPRARLFVWPQEALGGLPERQFTAMTGVTLARGEAARLAANRLWLGRSPTPEAIANMLYERGSRCIVPCDGNDRWQPFDTAQREALVSQYAEDLAWLRSGAGGHATLIERADGKDLRAMDRTGGSYPDDRQEDDAGLG